LDASQDIGLMLCFTDCLVIPRLKDGGNLKGM